MQKDKQGKVKKNAKILLRNLHGPKNCLIFAARNDKLFCMIISPNGLIDKSNRIKLNLLKIVTNMNYQGIVKAVGGLQTYTTEQGYTVYRRNIVVEDKDGGKTADSGCFTLRGLDAKHFDEKNIGNDIQLCFNLKTFETRNGKVCNFLPVFHFLMSQKEENQK